MINTTGLNQLKNILTLYNGAVLHFNSILYKYRITSLTLPEKKMCCCDPHKYTISILGRNNTAQILLFSLPWYISTHTHQARARTKISNKICIHHTVAMLSLLIKSIIHSIQTRQCIYLSELTNAGDRPTAWYTVFKYSVGQEIYGIRRFVTMDPL